MRAEVRPQADKFAGGHRIRVPPVPIPNTEVKPDTADGTIWETVWESRSLPALLQRPEALCLGPFSFSGSDGLDAAVSHADHRRAVAPRGAERRAIRKATIWETVWESRSLPAFL